MMGGMVKSCGLMITTESISSRIHNAFRRSVEDRRHVQRRDIDKMESVCRSVLVMLRAMDDAGIDVGQSIKEIEDAIGIG